VSTPRRNSRSLGCKACRAVRQPNQPIHSDTGSLDPKSPKTSQFSVIWRFIGIESHASESYYHSYTVATSGVNRLASQICHNRLFRKKLQQNIVRMISTEVSSLATHNTTYPDDYPFEYLLEFVPECKDLVSFFHNNHFYQALLTKSLEEKGLRMLQRPGPTRWWSIQACLYSILKAERVLHWIVSNRNFIHGTSKQKAGQIKIVSRLCLNPSSSILVSC
jgi:hypothetical protein